MSVVVMVLGCRWPDAPDAPAPHDGDPTDSTAEVLTGTGDTGPKEDTTTVDPDCLGLPAPGPFALQTIDIQTEEDFDFDRNGYLVAQHLDDLVGYTRAGQRVLIAIGIDADPAGIRALQTGDYVLASPSTGTIVLVNGLTGGSQIALGGLSYPNGLEVSADGHVYVTEFFGQGRVRTLDPYTGEQGTIVDSNANGIALDPAENRLYLSTLTPVTGLAAGRLGYLERDPTGAWLGPLTTILESESLLEGLTTDKCGNLYGVETYTGRVFRIRVADGGLEEVASLEGQGSFSGARFGNGYGDWARTTLYVTNRQRIFAIEIGIEGRHVLAY